MKTKTKTLLISVLTIVLCLSLVVGATFALFTSNSQVDIAVTSGKVEVHASLTNLKIYSAAADEEGTLVDENGSKYKHVELDSFANGGTAVIDGGTLTLDKISAGDKVEFDVEIINASDIAIKYQTSVKLVSGYDLFKGLNVTIDDTPYSGLTEVASWEDLAPTVTDVETKHVVVELPITAGNEYQNLTTSIQFAVEAVQGNAVTVDVDPTAINVFTATDLEIVANMVNSGNKMSGKTIKLVNDIDFANGSMSPIGSQDGNKVAFEGTFDGNGKTIKNVNITGESGVGLIGYIGGGTLKNVNLENLTVTGIEFVGALVGYTASGSGTVTGCTVKNCTLNGVMRDETDDSANSIGGLIGYVCQGGGNPISFTDNHIENLTINGYRNLGSFVGRLQANDSAHVLLDGNTAKDVTISQDLSLNGNPRGVVAGETVGQWYGDHREDNPSAEYINAIKTNNPVENVKINVVAPIVVPQGSASSLQEVFKDTVASASAGDTFILPSTSGGDDLKVPNISQNITLKGTLDSEGNPETMIDAVGSGSIASVPNGATFENMEFTFGENNYHGFQHAGKITFKNCVLNGKFFSYGDMEFIDCTFNAPSTDYSMWLYGKDATFKDCTFNGYGKWFNVYNEGNTENPWKIVFEGCEFFNLGEEVKKAAINIKDTSGDKKLKYDVTITNCSVNDESKFPAKGASGGLNVLDPLVQVDDIKSGDGFITVTLDGVKVFSNLKS